jgi:hypothetical protein
MANNGKSGGAFSKLKDFGGKTGHLNAKIYKTRKFMMALHHFIPVRTDIAGLNKFGFFL